jgi:hypothetical protein
MKALITGASSGIGLEMAKYLSSLGHEVILVANDERKLNSVKDVMTTNAKVYCYDLSVMDNCFLLYDKVKDEKIDIVINNAGYGIFGDYEMDNIDREMNMIDLNVKCLHILTKLFVNNKNTKYIMNVASSAGLMKGGPLMSGYYATKSYVCSYSFALYEELRRRGVDKHISVLCPGPVNTNFNKVANVKFNIKSLEAPEVAKYAIDKMFKNKLLIIPGTTVRLGVFFSRFLPLKTLLKITYKIQDKKR